MDSRERVERCMNRKTPDRLPIRHLAVDEINGRLFKYLKVDDEESMLKRLGVDFRDIRPLMKEGCNYGITERNLFISAYVWDCAINQAYGRRYPLAEITDISEIPDSVFAKPDAFDYSVIREECEKYPDHMRIFGYCEFNFIAAINDLRGAEQTYTDIALKENVYLDLLRKRFEFTMEHIELGLKAGGGLIDIVHFGDDFGSQRGLLISPQSFNDIFAPMYKEAYALAHKYGAKTMLHCCGSCRDLIGRFIDLGLDILDVVQTNAARMVLEELKEEFGRDIVFAGSMCVQNLIPNGTPAQVREEALKRAELFREGGLIYGPSHLLQVDSKLLNIVELYGAILGVDL